MRSRLILPGPELINTQFRQTGTRLFAMILLRGLRLKNFFRALQSESPQSATQSFFLYRHDSLSLFQAYLSLDRISVAKALYALAPLDEGAYSPPGFP